MQFPVPRPGMLSVSACPKLKASSRGKSIPNRSKKALSRVFFRPTMASQMPISLIHGRMQEEKALTAGNSISPRRSTWEQKCLLNSRHAQVKRNKHGLWMHALICSSSTAHELKGYRTYPAAAPAQVHPDLALQTPHALGRWAQSYGTTHAPNDRSRASGISGGNTLDLCGCVEVFSRTAVEGKNITENLCYLANIPKHGIGPSDLRRLR